MESFVCLCKTPPDRFTNINTSSHLFAPNLVTLVKNYVFTRYYPDSSLHDQQQLTLVGIIHFTICQTFLLPTSLNFVNLPHCFSLQPSRQIHLSPLSVNPTWQTACLPLHGGCCGKDSKKRKAFQILSHTIK